jgi:7-carboxy-7-deazaguanine synthase
MGAGTKVSMEVISNPQAAEKPVSMQRNDLDPLIEVACPPWKTVQGEGPHAGRPAVFVRLAGCNLQCPNCDTNYTTNRNTVSIVSLVADVNALLENGRKMPFSSPPLVVITGGEPLRQEATNTFVRSLLYLDIEVQIETNGTLHQDLPFLNDNLTVVCSPKTPKLNPDLAKYITAYKYVVAHGRIDPKDGLPTEVLGVPHRVARPGDTESLLSQKPEVYVQPEEVASSEDQTWLNVTTAADVCVRYGYRLSLQLHKIVGLD